MNLLHLVRIHLITVLFITANLILQAQSTTYFEFHNNFWINLHHYLYQQATGSQLAQLHEDGLTFTELKEEDVLRDLDESDKQAIKNAIDYYKAHLADKHLRRDLSELSRWLQAMGESVRHPGSAGDVRTDPRPNEERSGIEEITDTSYTSEYTSIMNAASKAYQVSLWPIHQQLNRDVLDNYLTLIRETESEVIEKMEQLADYRWPDSVKVRVDLTVYANYAGAYTVTRPNLNIYLSTIDPLNNTSSFVETIFHEGSHVLYNMQDSPFRGAIYNMSEEMNIEFPNGLWHASMFYLCGRATADALKPYGINHKLDMDIRNIYASYNTPEFRNILESYYTGNNDMQTTVANLLRQLE